MKLVILGALLFFLPFSAIAQDDALEKDPTDKEIKEILHSIGYPELQVVPRASERLRMEARYENNYWWISHWPVQVSGLMTMYVGMTATSSHRDDLSDRESRDAKTVATLTTGAGLAWVAGGILLGAQKPYVNGIRAVNRISGKDDRSTLMKERMAEEALERPARVMRILQHLSVFSNFALNAANIHYADEEGKMMAGLAAFISFLPYMFEDNSIAVYNKHIEYKKKIYAPLKTASFHVDSETGALTPMTGLLWTF